MASPIISISNSKKKESLENVYLGSIGRGQYTINNIKVLKDGKETNSIIDSDKLDEFILKYNSSNGFKCKLLCWDYENNIDIGNIDIVVNYRHPFLFTHLNRTKTLHI